MNKIENFFRRRCKVIKSVPWYGWAAGVLFMVLQYGLYLLADLIARVSGTIAWAFAPKLAFDNMIPFIPIFVIVYVYSYLFWIMGPIAVSLTKKENNINFCIGYPIALFIGFIIFILAPTYMNRAAEGLTEIVSNDGFIYALLRLIYNNDGGTITSNLLPSFHCLISLYMYLGVARRKEISLAFRIYSLIMVILISLSTVFIKQHYIIDVFFGLAISLIVFFIIEIINPGEKILAKRRLKVKTAK